MMERGRILAEDHDRRCLTLPHMMDAQWDFLEMGMTHLAADYPQHFSLARDGDHWHWENRLLGSAQSFIFGDSATLPMEPMEFVGRQMQGDFCLLDQREGDLYLDAGLVTFPADWSLSFDLGMSFEDWHGPVPIAHGEGRLHAGQEVFDEPPGGPALAAVQLDGDGEPAPGHRPGDLPPVGAGPNHGDAENAGELTHLRVEVQVLARLPRSTASCSASAPT